MTNVRVTRELFFRNFADGGGDRGATVNFDLQLLSCPLF